MDLQGLLDKNSIGIFFSASATHYCGDTSGPRLIGLLPPSPPHPFRDLGGDAGKVGRLAKASMCAALGDGIKF